MKKLLTWILLITLCLSLCGCSREEAIETTQTFISQAKEALGDFTEEPTDPFVGKWYIELKFKTFNDSLYSTTLVLNEDMTYKFGRLQGTWHMNEDYSKLYLDGAANMYTDYSFRVLQEDGFTKLLCDNELYVREEDYQAALDKKFFVAGINNIEYENYFGPLKFVSQSPKNWSSFPTTLFMLENKLYEEGLLYAGHSNTFEMTLAIQNGKEPFVGTLTEPFGFIAIDRTDAETVDYTIEHIVGKVWFIRSEYVESITEENGFRTLKLKSGYIIEALDNRFWDLIPDVDPYDFPM